MAYLLTRIDYSTEYQQNHPAAMKIHSSLLGNLTHNVSTYGLQLYNDALTDVEYNITFTVTYKSLSNASLVPEVLLAAHDYDLDYYHGYVAALPNGTEPLQTHGHSKHHDLLHITNKTKFIQLTNKTASNGNDIQVAYFGNNTLTIKKKTYQKFYFTLVNNASISAEECHLSFEMKNKNGQPLFTFADEGN